MVEGVVVILRRGDRFLLGKRASWKECAPNFWTAVTGRIEPEEKESEAVVREALEEIGIEVKPIKKLLVRDSDDGTARLNYWYAEIVEGEPFLNNDEHTELKWVTIEEMKSMENVFLEDVDILNSLLKEFK